MTYTLGAASHIYITDVDAASFASSFVCILVYILYVYCLKVYCLQVYYLSPLLLWPKFWKLAVANINATLISFILFFILYWYSYILVQYWKSLEIRLLRLGSHVFYSELKNQSFWFFSEKIRWLDLYIRSNSIQITFFDIWWKSGLS